MTGLLAAGCAGPERKLGRGMNNFYELVRGGEMRRTVEQTALFESPDTAYTTGVIRGFNRSMARAGVGLYEIVTFPIPSYDPIATKYLKPEPVYPDNFKPRLMDDANFATDTALGFTGGDIAPFIPGSRFRVFDN
jgi:putative exosortase-associated protein (TIGR04073 family)